MGGAGELDVVDIASLAGDEARVLDPLDQAPRTSAVIAYLLLVRYAVAPDGAAAPAFIVDAASRIAATMLW